jgi:hypothetical protein
VKAVDFDVLFARYVADPAATVGFERWGTSLWFSRGGLRAALLRTELRGTWPFELTLVLSHDCVRDFEGRAPAPRSRNTSVWPVKLQPSRAEDFLERWRYQPWNTGRVPADTMSDRKTDALLDAIGRALTRTFPRVTDVLTPAAMLDQLVRYGEDAWCEQRWIADYRRVVESAT